MNARNPAPLVGIVEGMENEDYHASEGLSNSGLTLLAKCPALFYARNLDPNRPRQEEKGGQLEGTLAHCAILEPDAFSDRYAVPPADAPRRPTDAQWNAKKPSEESIAAMAWWFEWNDKNKGRRVITSAQYEAAMRQGESARKLPRVREVLSNGRPELSAWAIDPDTGVLKKCRPDFTHEIGDSEAILMDVKTYSDASPDEFARQIARKGYFRQDAHYRDTFSQASGRIVREFFFLAVETEYPYLAKAVTLDDMALEWGRFEVARLTSLYAECLKTNDWPGYGDDTTVVSLPGYIFPKFDSEEIEVSYV